MKSCSNSGLWWLHSNVCVLAYRLKFPLPKWKLGILFHYFTYSTLTTNISVYLRASFVLFLFWALAALMKMKWKNEKTHHILHWFSCHVVVRKAQGHISIYTTKESQTTSATVLSDQITISLGGIFSAVHLIPGINGPINTNVFNVQKILINWPCKFQTYGGDCISVKHCPNERFWLKYWPETCTPPDPGPPGLWLDCLWGCLWPAWQ